MRKIILNKKLSYFLFITFLILIISTFPFVFFIRDIMSQANIPVYLIIPLFLGLQVYFWLELFSVVHINSCRIVNLISHLSGKIKELDIKEYFDFKIEYDLSPWEESEDFYLIMNDIKKIIDPFNEEDWDEVEPTEEEFTKRRGGLPHFRNIDHWDYDFWHPPPPPPPPPRIVHN